MTHIPENIRGKFLKVIRGQLPLVGFEKWIYQTKQLELLLPAHIYLALISLDYSTPQAWDSILTIFREYFPARQLKHVSFAEWTESIFNLPVFEYPGDLEHFAVQMEDRELYLRHLANLLKNPGKALGGYSADQMGQGLTFLFDGMYQENHVLLDLALDWNPQQKAIESVEILFQDIFATYSEPSHPDYADSEKLDYIRFMWWDLFPTWGTPMNEFMRTHHDDAILKLMERILNFKSMACIESALHGLNHWAFNYRERVCGIIDRFLRRRRLPAAIIEQAEAAKKVQYSNP